MTSVTEPVRAVVLTVSIDPPGTPGRSDREHLAGLRPRAPSMRERSARIDDRDMGLRAHRNPKGQTADLTYATT